MSKCGNYYSDDYDGPDMSEDELHPYEGPDVVCKECNRDYSCSTHEDAKEELCGFCKGEATCNNEGCTAQARVYDKESGMSDSNYCEPCWADLCESTDEYKEFGLFLPPEQHTPF